MPLQDYISQLNANIFFREFAFSRNEFSPPQKSEVEFADHVVWLDDLLITFQLKERDQVANQTPEAEEKWFRNKVLKKAVQQIKETKKYLDTYDSIEIANEKGHVFNVASATLKNQYNVVLYAGHSHLPQELELQKSYISSTVGFIHIFNADTYLDLCRALITPAEISEYLQFRENVVRQWKDEVAVLSEQSLLGQFLYGELDVAPNVKFSQSCSLVDQNHEGFALSHVLHLFSERITVAANPTDYYRILKELAKLNRNELREVKIRLSLCMEKCKNEELELPYRATFPRTGCSFVFVIVPQEWANQALVALQNYTYAHKYDQKLVKCVGACFVWDAPYYDIGWCLIEENWVYDAEMEHKLKENFPFRPVKEETFPRYTFGAKSD